MQNTTIKNYIVFGGLIALLSAPMAAGATDVIFNPLSYDAIRPPLVCETIACLLERIINFISWIIFLAAPIMILIAAFHFLFSAGNPEKVRTAKNILTYTVVGLLIIIFSRAFVAIIQSFFQ